jgi:integrase
MKNRKRRGRGEGSVYQRADGLWIASISLGYDGSGKRQRLVVAGRSKREALETLEQKKHQVNSGAVILDAERISVAAYLARWLETAKERVQPKTHLRYEQLVRLRINPALGSVQLAKLTPLHVEQLFAGLRKAGVSARGCQMAGTMLHTALRDAVRLRLIPNNPAREIAKPKPRKAEVQVWDRGQVLRFLDAARGDRLYALYVLALDTGMRQGELFALRWADFDFGAGAVLVQRSLEEINGRLRVKETKSARGRRRIDLSRFALAALHEHRKRMLADGHAEAPVFCDLEGGWLRKGNVLRRSYWKVIEAANRLDAEQAEKEQRAAKPLPFIRFHDLRHTCATLLLLADENVKVVSERLGHASVQLTLDTYSHVLPSMQARAAAKMDGILAGSAAVG